MLQRWAELYKKAFSIDEIEKDPKNQYLYVGLLVGFFVSFSYWIRNNSITTQAVRIGEHVCLPYFQECSSLYFHSLDGWLSLKIWYVLLTIMVLFSVYCAYRKKWAWAHFLILLPTIWKIIYLFVWTNNEGTDYEYFHLPVLLVFLFSKNKFYFSRLIFVVVYSTAAAMKFDSSWIAGTYFLSVKEGLPLFSDWLILFITNGVILFEIFGSWALLSSNKIIKNASLALWCVFHLYSVLLVEYRYPLHCMSVILPLFLVNYDSIQRPRFELKNAFSYFAIGLMYALCLLTLIIPGDTKYNLKNMKFGVRMFDANHQCYSEIEFIKPNGEVQKTVEYNVMAMKRCQPYFFWYKAKNLCRATNNGVVGWKFYSSINGGPFYELVNGANICGTEYSIFEKNSWYAEPSEGARIEGYAHKNSLDENPINLKKDQIIFAQTEYVPDLKTQFVLDNMSVIKIFYWVLWSLVNCWCLFLVATNSRLIKK